MVPVGFMVLRLVELSRTDAVIPLDGATHDVRVEADDDRMIWVDVDAPTPDCEVRDATSGDQVELHRVNLKTVREGENGDESGRWQFDPGSGDLEVSCSRSDGRRQRGDRPGSLRTDHAHRLRPLVPARDAAERRLDRLAGVLVVKLARRPEEPPPPPAWTRPG